MNRKEFIGKICASSFLFPVFGSCTFGKSAEPLDNLPDIYKDSGVSPILSNRQSSSLVFFGDMQRYSKDTVMQPIVDMMVSWVLKKRKILNVKGVLFTGDFVENNDYKFFDTGLGDYDMDSSGQWNFVSKYIGRFDNVLPVVAATGNHDYGFRCFENRNTHFNDVFKKGRNSLTDSVFIESFPNSFGIKSLENACYEIDLGGKWGKVIIFSLEFCPRDEVLQWIHLKCVSDFADRRVFLLLHDYIDMEGAHTGKPSFAYVKVVPTPQSNGGADVWQKLVRKTPNIALVLNGHADGKTTSISDNSFLRTDVNDSGKKVFSMAFAMHGRRYDGHGADGWLRILEFLSDGNTVNVSTFSPYLFYSMNSKKSSRPHDDKNEFSFKLD